MSDDHWSPTGRAGTESVASGRPAWGGLSTDTFEATVRRHPYGGILTGLGVGWVLGAGLVRLFASDASSRADRHDEDPYRDLSSRGSRAADRVASVAGQAASRAGGIAGQAADRAGDLASRAGSAVSDAASSVGEAVSSVYSSAADSVSSAGRRVSVGGAGLARRHPLAVCAAGLAIGAAIGASLPATEVENRFLGESSDALKERMRELAAEQFEKAKTTAAHAYDEALDEAEAQGIDRDMLSRVGEQVGAAAEAAKDSAQAVADRLKSDKPG